MAVACLGQLGAEPGEEGTHLASATTGVPRRPPQLCVAGRHQQLFSVGNRSSQNKEGIKRPPKGPIKTFNLFLANCRQLSFIGCILDQSRGGISPLP